MRWVGICCVRSCVSRRRYWRFGGLDAIQYGATVERCADEFVRRLVAEGSGISSSRVGMTVLHAGGRLVLLLLLGLVLVLTVLVLVLRRKGV